jgi:type 1 glutamine amidotransferase
LGLLRFDADLEVLLVTKGHPFERDAFFGVFEGWPDIACTSVEQPAAQLFFEPKAAEPYDAFVLYDMPGIQFGAGAPHFEPPSPAYQKGFRELLDRGQGIVFLHHAIAGWPSWPEYSEIMGGRFLYQPGELRGEQWPDSGYRHAVTHRVRAEAPGHPVLAGLEDGFEIEDELYLCPIFEDEVTPLLRSDHVFEDSGFYSAAQALQGKLYSNEGWSHPKGSNLVAWCKRAGASPIVTILCGDSANAYANPGFRKLVENAIRWVASEEAHAWARGPTER